MWRPQLGMRTLLILVALSAVLMSVTAGVRQWREDTARLHYLKFRKDFEQNQLLLKSGRVEHAGRD